MIDTNLIPQAAQDVATIKTQLSPYLPALAVAAAWAGREIRNVNLYVENVAAKIIAHGGLGMIVKKLLWNPGASPVAASGKEEGK